MRRRGAGHGARPSWPLVPLEQLRVACGVSRDGSKASEHRSAARTLRLPTPRGFKKEPSTPRELPMPASSTGTSTISWCSRDFARARWLNDPARGPRARGRRRTRPGLHRRRPRLRARPAIRARRPSALGAALASPVPGRRRARAPSSSRSCRACACLPGLVIPGSAGHLRRRGAGRTMAKDVVRARCSSGCWMAAGVRALFAGCPGAPTY